MFPGKTQVHSNSLILDLAEILDKAISYSSHQLMTKKKVYNIDYWFHSYKNVFFVDDVMAE
jgi:hypothetical protein